MRLSESALTNQQHTFYIDSSEVNGPLNLERTVQSAQTSEPEWIRNNGSFTDVEVISGTPVKYALSQAGKADNFVVKVHLLSSRSDERLVEELRSHLNQVLGLQDDLELFYREFIDESEPLSATFPKLRGLRLMHGTNLFESLICSILSQNNSARLWNRTARLMMRYYGDRVDFPDGTTSYIFPKPETLSKLTARELRSKTSMGYRAKSVVQVCRLIARNELQLEEVSKRSYEEAISLLLDLPGVGPKVADCFLLYGAGKLEAAPVDVWIHRIISKVYFGGRKISRLRTARFLRERFGAWAGYAQLYLFDYARRTTAGTTTRFRKADI